MTKQAVKALRLSRGHSLTAAALVAGVTRRTWVRWESGQHPPDPHVIELYAIKTLVLDTGTARP